VKLSKLRLTAEGFYMLLNKEDRTL